MEINDANPTYHTLLLKHEYKINNIIHLDTCDAILAIEFKYNLFVVNVATVNTDVIKLNTKFINTIINKY